MTPMFPWPEWQIEIGEPWYPIPADEPYEREDDVPEPEEEE